MGLFFDLQGSLLTNIKSECNAPLLSPPPLARQIIIFKKKFTSLSKGSFHIECLFILFYLFMQHLYRTLLANKNALMRYA